RLASASSTKCPKTRGRANPEPTLAQAAATSIGSPQAVLTASTPAEQQICVQVIPPEDENGSPLEYHRRILFRRRRTAFDAWLAEFGLIHRLTVPLATSTLSTIWNDYIKDRLADPPFAYQLSQIPHIPDSATAYERLPVRLLTPKPRPRNNGTYTFEEGDFLNDQQIRLNQLLMDSKRPGRNKLCFPEGNILDIWFVLKRSDIMSFLPQISPGLHQCVPRRVMAGFQSDDDLLIATDPWTSVQCDCASTSEVTNTGQTTSGADETHAINDDRIVRVFPDGGGSIGFPYDSPPPSPFPSTPLAPPTPAELTLRADEITLPPLVRSGSLDLAATHGYLRSRGPIFATAPLRRLSQISSIQCPESWKEAVEADSRTLEYSRLGTRRPDSFEVTAFGGREHPTEFVVTGVNLDEAVQNLKLILEQAIDQNDARKLYTPLKRCAIHNEGGDTRSSGDGVLREVINCLLEKLYVKKFSQYFVLKGGDVVAVAGGSSTLHPELISESREREFKVLGAAVAFHLALTGSLPIDISPAMMQYLAHDFDIHSLTEDFLAATAPSSLERVRQWKEIGCAGDVSSTEWRELLSLELGLEAATLRNRTEAQHDWMAAIILQHLVVGLVTAEIKALKIGFEVACPNGYRLIDSIHAFKQGSHDFFLAASKNVIQDFESIRPILRYNVGNLIVSRACDMLHAILRQEQAYVDARSSGEATEEMIRQ
ncbi:hypothetical protein FRC02_004545, partial [Tulasnella sp. 418]